MSKENINDKRINVSESYRDLDLGEISPGTDEHRAVLDAIIIGGDRKASFGEFYACSILIPSIVQDGDQIRERVNNKVEGLCKINGDESDYSKVLRKVNTWLEKDYVARKDSEMVDGKRLNYLKEEFGIRRDKIIFANFFRIRGKVSTIGN